MLSDHFVLSEDSLILTRLDVVVFVAEEQASHGTDYYLIWDNSTGRIFPVIMKHRSSYLRFLSPPVILSYLEDDAPVNGFFGIGIGAFLNQPDRLDQQVYIDQMDSLLSFPDHPYGSRLVTTEDLQRAYEALSAERGIDKLIKEKVWHALQQKFKSGNVLAYDAVQWIEVFELIQTDLKQLKGGQNILPRTVSNYRVGY